MLQESDDKNGAFQRNYHGKLGFISLGANLPLGKDSPQKSIETAISRLQARDLVIRAQSRFFATPCFPPGAGPDYVNAAIAVDWLGAPEALLQLLHEVEAEFGRERDQRWGMRTLDLDLIALGAQVAPDDTTWGRWRDLTLQEQMQLAPDQLILPHPRIQDRAFVLVPLMDIAPDWVHPVLGRSVAEMTADLPAADVADVKPL